MGYEFQSGNLGADWENAEGSCIRESGAMHLRRKIEVAVAGATGCVGQRFLSLLDKHPWFELVAISASEKSVGMKYKDAVHWMQTTPIPERFQDMKLQSVHADLPCRVVFSALDSSIAGDVETAYAQKGYVVLSNASNHRMDAHVPLVVPEVNPQHLELVKQQGFAQGGMIVTNPNCAVIGLALALCPLHLEFGLEACHVVTMQASSGAGFPGVPSMSLLDNVIPYIAGEEDKIEHEPGKIFGTIENNEIIFHPLKISACATRVPVTEGHLEVVSVKLKKKIAAEDIIRAWQEFVPPAQEMRLPSSPRAVLTYFDQQIYPQPKMHRDVEKGMGVAIGRLRPASLFDYTFVILSHNTIRGAAGGTILLAEYLVKNGYIFW